MISPEIFKAARSKLAQHSNSSAFSRSIYDYLMLGRLKCSCGHSIHARTSNDISGQYLYYTCSARERFRAVKRCSLLAHRADEIDRAVWSWVVQKLQNFDTIRSTIAKDIEDTQRTNEVIYQRVRILDSRIAETQKQIQRMLDLYANSSIDQKYLDEKVEKLQSTVKELDAEQVELLERINEIPSQEQLKEIGELAETVRTAAEIDLKTRRAVLQIVKLQAAVDVEEGRRTLLITSSMGGEKIFVDEYLT